MTFFGIPNNNQGITLAYANNQNLFTTGVANSTAIGTFFSGGVGIGVQSGAGGSLNAVELQLSGNNISNIFITSNVLQITSNNLIGYVNYNSHILSNTQHINSNNLISYVNYNSNILVNYSNLINKPDLSIYLASASASSTYATITNITTTSNTLTNIVILLINLTCPFI
jgi:hypothetical protein